MTDNDERRLRDLLHDAAPEFAAVRGEDLRPPRRSPSGRSRAVLAAVAICLLIIGIGVALRTTSRDHRAATGPTSTPSGTATSTVSAPGLDQVVRKAPCGLATFPPPGTRTRTENAGAAAVARFRAIAVVNCRDGSRTYPGDGLWEVLTRQANTADLAAVTTALTRPDESPVPGENGCAAIGYGPLPVLLVDAAGKYLHPRAPQTACGAPLPVVTRTLAAVRWRTVTVTRVRQLQSEASLTSGCLPQYKDMIRVETDPTMGRGPAADPGSPVLTRLAGSALTACIYRTGGADPIAGTFTRAVKLSVARSSEIRAVLARPGTIGSCARQKEFALIGDTKGRNVAVELGGCWRVLRNDNQPVTLGRADASVLRDLLGLT